MQNPITKAGAALAIALLPLVTACSGDQDSETGPVQTREEATLTLATALSEDRSLGTVLDAMQDSGLSGVLEGSASYTILAPNDAAFTALGDQGSELLEEDQQAILIAILRDHLLPGHLTPESITNAIKSQGGPVTMTTLGGTSVTFSSSSDGVTVSTGGASSATLVGTAIAANNGVVIPIDAVLLPPRDD